MTITHIPCGPLANESEQKAVEHLKARLQSTQGADEWILLSNLAFSVNHQVQSDEIDLVVIGTVGRAGLPGLIHILIGCFNSFSKYAKLSELTKLGR